MHLFKKHLMILLLASISTINIYAVNTFTTVYNILQANCSDAGCHGAVNPIAFSVSGSETDVYNTLVGQSCDNQHAITKGYKLVDAGHPYNSFLLKKIGSPLDSYFNLHASEGDVMPAPQDPLENHEIELIRQWILMGAQQTGNKVNYQLLKDYYTVGGFNFIPVPAAPDPSEGMQIRLGPIFLAPGEEVEWDKKEKLRNPQQIKVYKTDGFMSWQSHHMLLFKFDDDGSSVRDGMRLVPSEAFPFNGNVALTGAWQNDAEFELPGRTAFFWEPNTALDFDYHIKNYSQTEILPSDFYLNIYWDTQGDRDIQMFAQLENNAILILPQGNQVRTSTASFNEDRYIYMMSSHTHQWGTDFDIFLRESNGSRGTQIYEGYYSEDYTFNQGFYDWEHPAIRYFEPLQKASHGLIYETTYNVGVPFVTFGLTADDEMMLFTYLYTKQPVPFTPTGLEDINNKPNSLAMYPNPFTANAEIQYTISQTADVLLEVYNLLGQHIATLVNSTMNEGNHIYQLNENDLSSGKGVYFVSLSVDGKKVATSKVFRN